MTAKYKWIAIHQKSRRGDLYIEYMIVTADLDHDFFERAAADLSDAQVAARMEEMADKVVGSAPTEKDADLIVAALNAYKGH